jgi:hypothetical protein
MLSNCFQRHGESTPKELAWLCKSPDAPYWQPVRVSQPVGKFSTDQPGYADMQAVGRRFTERIWAVEGCNGVGRHIAHRLVHDGGVVLDVPVQLSA